MAKSLYRANSSKGIVKNHGILIGITAFLFVFILGTGLAIAQTWKEPSTKPPGDPKAANIPELLRISSTSGKQVKEGKLRIGSAKSSDIFSTLEVFGNLQIQNNLLVDISGVCANPADCVYDAAAGEKTPLLFVQNKAGVKSVGIGTNKLDSPLMVHAAANEYPNGAVYATSSTDHAVKGVSTVNSNAGAGVFAFAPSEYQYAVFGKTVDIAHNGIMGTTATAAPAALFKGNVLVTGGFLQGDGSQLWSVSNVNDASFDTNTGARGLSVWATTTPAVHTIAPSGDTTIDLGLVAGQRVRSVNIMIRKTGELFRMFPSAYSSDVTVSLDGSPGKFKFTNSSPSQTYEIRITAHIETGVSIALTYKDPSTGTMTPLQNPQTMLYQGSQTIELNATAQGGTSQNFKWEFLVPSTGGELCDIQAGNPTNCSVDAHFGASVFYKQAGSYTGSTPSDIMQVTWQVGAGVTEQFVLNFIDIQPPSNQAMQFDAGTGATPAEIVPVRVIVPSTYSTPFVTFELANKRGVADFLSPNPVSLDGSGFANGTYKAPNIGLDTIDSAEEVITASIFGYPNVKKTFSAYLVPNFSLKTMFVGESGDPYFGLPEAQRLSNTVAKNKDLSVQASLSSVPVDTPTSVSACSGCTGSGLSFVYNNSVLGAHILTLAWTPNKAPYPSGFSYAKSTTVYVGQITVNSASSVTQNVVVTTTFSLDGYPGETRYLATTPTTINNLSFSNADANPHIAGSSPGSMSAIATIFPNRTTVNFSSSTCSTYTVRGRSHFDLREQVDRTISVTGCSTGCTGCSGSKPPACCGDIGGDLGTGGL